MTKSDSELITNAKIMDIPIEKLKLDTNNVRFKHLRGKLSEYEIEQIIMQDNDTSVLCDQILAAGVVYEPLVTTSDYVVLEGNRRLVCLRLLQRDIERGIVDEKLSSKFAKVKCKVLPPNIENKSLDLYLAIIHVKGKKEWKTFNRANHVYRLNRVHGISYQRIAEELGMGKATIQRCVTVYKHLMSYARRFPDDIEWFHKFTYFDYFFQRKDLKDFRENTKAIEEFEQWVHDEKFSDVRDLYRLAEVVSDKDALSELKKNDFESALSILKEKDPSLYDQNFSKIKESLEALDAIRKSDLAEIFVNAEKKKMLIKLESEIKSLMVDLDELRSQNLVITKKV